MPSVAPGVSAVAGQIIKLDLSVAAVYEQVWARSAAALAHGEGASSPMVVVYRLQGLDGEATEPIVESVEEDGGEERDPEVEYAISDVVGSTGGLEVMLDVLRRATPLQRVRECAALLLKLLQHCVKIKANRTRVLAMGGPEVLMALLPQAFASASLSTVAERIVITVETLLEEELLTLPMPDDADAPPADDAMDVGDACAAAAEPSSAGAAGSPMEVDGAAALHGWAAHLRLLCDGLRSSAAVEAKPLVKAITRLLPLATRGEPANVAALLAYFAPYADFDALDGGGAGGDAEGHTFMLECLVATLSSTRSVSLGLRVKTAALQHGLAPRAATYLSSHLPGEKAGADLAAEWATALGRPALPFVLQLLGSLARGHTGVQQLLLSRGLMPRLHALERQSSSASKAVGTWAEALLEVLRERAAAEVDQLRKATSESKRKAALDKRKQILQSMGMKVQSAEEGGSGGEERVSGGAVIVSAAAPTVMEELEEESGHVCVVCGEGETYRPGETLGAYCFCKRVPLLGDCHSVAEAEAAPSVGMSGRHEACYATVSHFNIIHFSCHREATRAERTMKQVRPNPTPPHPTTPPLPHPRPRPPPGPSQSPASPAFR